MVPNITLMEVKKFVESVPKVLKEDEMRREADRLLYIFRASGTRTG
jgi:ribosomal protein L7/L12